MAVAAYKLCARCRAKSVRGAKKRRTKLRQMLAELKDVPCMDCRGKFPTCVMDFDHGTSAKNFAISTRLVEVSRERLLTEIAKCEVVCANCHRIRTCRATQRV
jgi:hypothetical protein